MSGYTKSKMKEINSAIEYLIEEHLSVLNSEIKLPQKNNIVNELRLLPTVKSRETVYNNLASLLDNENVNKNIKEKSQKRIIEGLKKTQDELLEKIIKQPLRALQSVKDNSKKDSDSILDLNDETTDDIVSSKSTASTVAIDLVLLINDRIEQIEDSESFMKRKLEQEIIPNITERFAKN